MIGDKWTIGWEDYLADAYMYGSKVIFHGTNDVEFYNCLVPSGTVLKKWHSKTLFQRDGIEPTLPIIDGEVTYKLNVNIEMPIPEGILVKLVFYNKYDVEVGNVIIRGVEDVFRCPLATYSYDIVLISAGADSFRFHSFTIQEVMDEPEKQTNKDKKRIWKNKKASKKNAGIKQ